jgi:hypothetical protein
MQVTAVLTPAAEGGFTAFNPETGTVSQGESLDEALANLREAVELYKCPGPAGVEIETSHTHHRIIVIDWDDD